MQDDRDEGTMRDFMAPEDWDDFEFYHEADWVLSWEAGLVLLDEHPWPTFCPLRVSP